jgi:hypothetical protein
MEASELTAHLRYKNSFGPERMERWVMTPGLIEAQDHQGTGKPLPESGEHRPLAS